MIGSSQVALVSPKPQRGIEGAAAPNARHRATPQTDVHRKRSAPRVTRSSLCQRSDFSL